MAIQNIKPNSVSEESKNMALVTQCQYWWNGMNAVVIIVNTVKHAKSGKNIMKAKPIILDIIVNKLCIKYPITTPYFFYTFPVTHSFKTLSIKILRKKYVDSQPYS